MSKTRSRTKTKRACDECAKARAKCDYQAPCDRCKKKSLNCEKTRKGYEDPYAMYSIATPATTPPVVVEPEVERGNGPKSQDIIDNEMIIGKVNNLPIEHSSLQVMPVDPALETSDSMS